MSILARPLASNSRVDPGTLNEKQQGQERNWVREPRLAPNVRNTAGAGFGELSDAFRNAPMGVVDRDALLTRVAGRRFAAHRAKSSGPSMQAATRKALFVDFASFAPRC